MTLADARALRDFSPRSPPSWPRPAPMPSVVTATSRWKRAHPRRVGRISRVQRLRAGARTAAEPARDRAEPAGRVPRQRDRGQALRRAGTRSTSSIKVGGTHFRVIGVNERKGSLFGQSQDDFIVDPARASSSSCSGRDDRSSSRSSRLEPSLHSGSHGRRPARAAGSNGGCGRGKTTTSACTRPTR